MQRLEISEKAYRALDLDSYSSIKVYVDNRQKYQKKYLLKQKVKEENETTNSDLRMGSLVDALLFTPDDLNEKFVLTKSAAPTGVMMDFVINLYNRTLISTTEEGVVTRDIGSLLADAYEDTKFKDGEQVAFKRKGDTLEKITERFLINKEGFDYYEDLRDRGGRIVITDQELENANRTVTKLRNHEYTRQIINKTTSIGFTVYNQLILKGSYRGLDVKCMSDLVHVDERSKIVYPYDLKTIWNPEKFDHNYLKYRYYLQCGLYTAMMKEYFQGYEVKPLSFIVADKIGNQDPVIYMAQEEHLKQALKGFTTNNITYEGLEKAVEDLVYHKTTNHWTSSSDVRKTGGMRMIKLY